VWCRKDAAKKVAVGRFGSRIIYIQSVDANLTQICIHFSLLYFFRNKFLAVVLRSRWTISAVVLINNAEIQPKILFPKLYTFQKLQGSLYNWLNLSVITCYESFSLNHIIIIVTHQLTCCWHELHYYSDSLINYDVDINFIIIVTHKLAVLLKWTALL
jgi:hypothetical protein